MQKRREIIRAAREYVAGAPGSDQVGGAYRKMQRLLGWDFHIKGNDLVLHTIADYIHNPEAEEAECDYMALHVNLPDCPKCGIDGSTAFHADSTDDKQVLICMFCGHIGSWETAVSEEAQP